MGNLADVMDIDTTAVELADNYVQRTDPQADLDMAQAAIDNPVIKAMFTQLLPRLSTSPEPGPRNLSPVEVFDFCVRAYTMRLNPLGEKPEVVPLRQTDLDGDNAGIVAFVTLDRLRADAMDYHKAQGYTVRFGDNQAETITRLSTGGEAILADCKADVGDVVVRAWVEWNRPQLEWVRLADSLKGILAGPELVGAIGPMPRDWERIEGIGVCRATETIDPKMRTAGRTATDRAIRRAISLACPGMDEWRIRSRPDYEARMSELLGMARTHASPEALAALRRQRERDNDPNALI
jgi:hypothetical protein